MSFSYAQGDDEVRRRGDSAFSEDLSRRSYNVGLSQVLPFYQMEKAGAFRDTDPRGAAFVNERLAAGAGELRDFIVSAWTASGSASIGWPAVKVAEVEAGTADPWIAMVGED